ncbi:MAG: metallophosphoesterase family protein [Candidatus Promineifilaceae bacterium]|nr:metallophosphoesterase family protein [Candidatus Promineifilaceae bacterium]
MRFLVLSDIHANLTAFETVLEAAQGQYDFLWCLGDVVGYGPSPNECVELLREQEHLALSGNHDWAALGRLDLDTFNPDARAAAEWTQQQLSDDSRAYLEQLESRTEQNGFTLAHASPRQPVWEYILDTETAAANFGQFESRQCLVGHTHVPVVYEQLPDGDVQALAPDYEQAIQLGERRLIVNPGSVGQPRDADPRAAYALLDMESMSWRHYRVSYDIEQTQERMLGAGLPIRLIARLSMGW